MLETYSFIELIKGGKIFMSDLKDLVEYIGYFFLAYMVIYTTFLFITVLFGALQLYKQDKMTRFRNELKHEYYVPISVLVPAYNEEVTIVGSINSLLNLDYKLYELVIINDGSKDNTSGMLIEAFQMIKTNKPIHGRLKCEKILEVYESVISDVQITLIVKENGGKGDALNAGINLSRYPYVITIDADSLLQRDSLEKIIQPVLRDNRIIAVGGMIRIAQTVLMEKGKVMDYHVPWNPIVGMQVVEYDRSFLASRILLDQFNANLIISGAFGLFKKEVLISVGGYATDTLGEDMELVMKINIFCINNGRDYKLAYEPNAICWSQSPSSLKDIIKQRKRWHLGLFQSLWKYRSMINPFKSGIARTFSYLYYVFFELLSPFIEVIGVLNILLAWYLNLLFLPYMIRLLIIYTIYNVLLSITAFFQRVYSQGTKMHFTDVIKAIIMVTLETVFYRYIISFVRATAFIGYRKNRKQWGTIERKEFNTKSLT